MPAQNSNTNISAIYSRVILLSFKSNHPLYSSKINTYLQNQSSPLPHFLLYTFSHRENYVLCKAALRKMFIAIIFCQARITEFHTHLILKSFSNSKYLAIAVSIYFVKVAK